MIKSPCSDVFWKNQHINSISGIPFGMRNKRAIIQAKKEMIMESLQLPKDILNGDMRITLTGYREAWIENYKGILEYSSESIILQGKNGKVQFVGKRLTIDYYTNEDMKLTGKITSINYL